MADTGWLSPGTSSQDNSGSSNWTFQIGDPLSTQNQAGAAAQGVGSGVTTNWLLGSNFGASVPSGATIDGIETRIYTTAGPAFGSNEAQEVTIGGGTTLGNIKSFPLAPNSYVVNGSSSDLWGTSLTAADVNSPGFIVAVRITGTTQFGFALGGLTVDHVQVKIHYTTGPGDVNLLPFVLASSSVSADISGTSQTLASSVSAISTISATLEGGTSPDTDTGWLNPNSAGQSSNNGAWSNVNSVLTNNFNNAEFINDFQLSNKLITNDFDVNIPPDSIVQGIEVRVYTDTYDNVDSADVMLFKDGSIGTSKTLSTTEGQYVVYGGPTDLWGTSLNAIDYNSADFGVALTGDNNSQAELAINNVQLKIYYAPGNLAAIPPNDTNWLNPTSSGQETSTNKWTNTADLLANNNSGADFIEDFTLSNTLLANDFDANIPVDSTISGIEVRVKFEAADNVDGGDIRLWRRGAFGSTRTLYYSDDGFFTFGGPNDLWGTSISPQDINSADFGIGLRADLSSQASIEIGIMQLRIYYTADGSSPIPSNDTGWVSPSIGEQSGGSDWSSVSDILTQNNTGAEFTQDFFLSNTLVARDFGLSVPSSNTVKGVEVRFYVNDAAKVDGGSVRLWNGSTFGNTRALYYSVGGYFVTGGPGDLWGATINPSDVNSANFGIGLRAELGSQANIEVDHIQVRIYHEGQIDPEFESTISTLASVTALLSGTSKTFSSAIVDFSFITASISGTTKTLSANVGASSSINADISGVTPPAVGSWVRYTNTQQMSGISTSGEAITLDTIDTGFNTGVYNISNNTVTLPASGRYLVMYDFPMEATGNASNRASSLGYINLNGSPVSASYNSSYLRVIQQAGRHDYNSATCIIDAAQNDTLELFVKRIDSNASNGWIVPANEANLTIYKLPDWWEWAETSNTNTQSIDSNSAPVNLGTLTQSGSLYTLSNGTDITISESGTYLIASSIYCGNSGGRSGARASYVLNNASTFGGVTTTYIRNANGDDEGALSNTTVMGLQSGDSISYTAGQTNGVDALEVGLSIVKLPSGANTSVYRNDSTQQLLAQQTDLPIQWDTTVVDDLSSLSNNSRLTVNRTSTFLLTHTVYFIDPSQGANARDRPIFEWRINGNNKITSGISGQYNRAATLYDGGSSGSSIVDLSNNDYIELLATDDYSNQNGGSTTGVQPTGTYATLLDLPELIAAPPPTVDKEFASTITANANVTAQLSITAGLTLLGSTINAISTVAGGVDNGIDSVFKGAIQTITDSTTAFSHDSEGCDTLVISLLTSTQPTGTTYDSIALTEQAQHVSAVYHTVYTIDDPSPGSNTVNISGLSNSDVFGVVASNLFDTSSSTLTFTENTNAVNTDIFVNRGSYTQALVWFGGGSGFGGTSDTFQDGEEDILVNEVGTSTAIITEWFSPKPDGTYTIGHPSSSTGSTRGTLGVEFDFVEPGPEFTSNISVSSTTTNTVTIDPGFVTSINATTVLDTSLTRQFVISSDVSNTSTTAAIVNRVEELTSDVDITSSVVLEIIGKIKDIVAALTINTSSSNDLTRVRLTEGDVNALASVISLLNKDTGLSTDITNTIITDILLDRNRSINATSSALSTIVSSYAIDKSLITNFATSSNVVSGGLRRVRRYNSTLNTITSASAKIAGPLAFVTSININTIVNNSINRTRPYKSILNAVSTLQSNIQRVLSVSSDATQQTTVSATINRTVDYIASVIGDTTTINTQFDRLKNVRSTITNTADASADNIVRQRAVQSDITGVAQVTSLLGKTFNISTDIENTSGVITGFDNLLRAQLSVSSITGAIALIERDLQFISIIGPHLTVSSFIDSGTGLTTSVGANSNVDAALIKDTGISSNISVNSTTQLNVLDTGDFSSIVTASSNIDVKLGRSYELSVDVSAYSIRDFNLIRDRVYGVDINAITNIITDAKKTFNIGSDILFNGLISGVTLRTRNISSVIELSAVASAELLRQLNIRSDVVVASQVETIIARALLFNTDISVLLDSDINISVTKLGETWLIVASGNSWTLIDDYTVRLEDITAQYQFPINILNVIDIGDVVDSIAQLRYNSSTICIGAAINSVIKLPQRDDIVLIGEPISTVTQLHDYNNTVSIGEVVDSIAMLDETNSTITLDETPNSVVIL